MYISSSPCMLHSPFILLSLFKSPTYLAKTNFIIYPPCTFLVASVTSCIVFCWKVNNFLDDREISCSCGNRMSLFVVLTGFTGPRPRVFEIYLLFSSIYPVQPNWFLLWRFFLVVHCLSRLVFSYILSLCPSITRTDQMSHQYTEGRLRFWTAFPLLLSTPRRSLPYSYLFPFLCCTHTCILNLTHWRRAT
jgi:hypothetical protein